MGTANEILQIDAGWCRTSTIIDVRKVKLAKRISEKQDNAQVKRILIKAIQLNTQWCKEAAELTKIRLDHLPRITWKKINQITKRIKHEDLKSQFTRLQDE